MSKDYKYRVAKPPTAKPQNKSFLWFISGTLLGAFFIGLAWLKLTPELLTGKDTKTTPPVVHQKTPEVAAPTDTAAPNSPLKFEFANMLRDAKVELPVHDANAPPPKPTQPPPALAPKPLAPDEPNQNKAIGVEPTAPPATVADAEPTPRKHSERSEPARTQKSRHEHSTPEKVKKVHKKNREKPIAEAVTKTKKATHTRERTTGRVKVAEKSRNKALALQLGAFKNDADMRKLRASMAMLGVETKVQTVVTKDHKTIHRLRTNSYSSKAELDEARRLLNKHKVKAIVVE